MPVPHADAAARTEALGLGTRRVASQLLAGRPEPSWVEAASAQDSNAEHLAWPVEGAHLGRGFGFVRRAALRHRRHDGIDIPAVPGTPVQAVEGGLVAYADNGVRGFGNLVLVVHPDGKVSLYAHLSESRVTAGDLIERGEVLGKVGSTGLSRGPHLHFEWRVSGHPRDPLPLFAAIPQRPRRG